MHSVCEPVQYQHKPASHLHEGEEQHEDEVADPVEGQGQTHGSSTGLLTEDLTHHNEGDGSWAHISTNVFLSAHFTALCSDLLSL